VTDVEEAKAASSTSGRRRAPSRSWSRAVPALAIPVILLAAGFRAAEASRTWFYQDDFKIIGIVSRDGLTLQQLFTPYLGHLMPSGKLAAWVIDLWPAYDYTPVVIEVVILVVFLGWGAMRMLVTLFGARPAVLVLLVYLLFNPWLIEPVAWWAAGINHLPALAATCFAVASTVRYAREPRGRDLAASVGWVLLGLSFAELALLAYVPMTVLVLGYFTSGTLWERVLSTWQDYRSFVMTHGVVVLSYVALYLWRLPEHVGQRDPVPWRGYLINMFGVLVPSGFVGGPTDWNELGGAVFRSAPPPALQVVSLVTLAGVFALSAVTRVRGLRAWLIPVLQLAVVVLLLAQNRAIWGQDFILDPRTSTVMSLAFTLAVGLAFLHVPDAVECAERREGHWLVDRPEPTLVAMAAFLVLAVVSTVSFPLLHVAPSSGPREYMRAFERSLASHDGPVQLVDRPIDPRVASGLDAEYSIVLAPYGARVQTPDVVQDEFYVLSGDGRIVRPGFEVARRAQGTVPAGDCPGYSVGAEGRTIPLNGPVIGYVWRLRLSYDAPRTTPGRVSFGGDSEDVTFQSGRHVMEMGTAAPRRWNEVTIDGLDSGAEVCVTQTLVGTTTVPGS
jgi:hypothetical protein